MKRLFEDIAIIGISCNFPGAESKEKYWDNLKNRVVSTDEILEERWVKWKTILEGK